MRTWLIWLGSVLAAFGTGFVVGAVVEEDYWIKERDRRRAARQRRRLQRAVTTGGT